MTDRRLQVVLEQMFDAIDKTRGFAADMSFEDYNAAAKTRYAVERCIEIISEASRRLPQSVHDRHPAIPWDDIRDIGNIIRHGYDRIDDRIIWTVLRRHLEPLEAALKLIACEEGLTPTDPSN